jgi:hypothetical protein
VTPEVLLGLYVLRSIELLLHRMNVVAKLDEETRLFSTSDNLTNWLALN